VGALPHANGHPGEIELRKDGAIADYLVNLIVSCDGADFQDRLADYDSTPTELEYMNSVFSDLFQQFGIAELKSREDIDRVVRMMTGTFGL
jgi:hypothetical protein